MDCHSSYRFDNLELRNFCPEPSRQCHPVWHIVQLPVRRRSATPCGQCDSRFLQDRVAHNGCDPGSVLSRPDADSNTIGDSYTYGDGDADSHTYGDTYCHTNRHAKCDCDCESESDAYS